MVMMFVNGGCVGAQRILYYSYCRKPTGREFSFPPEPIVVKLLTQERDGDQSCKSQVLSL